MSTQQDIYAVGCETRPPILNKENYVPWSSRLLRYAKSRPNGKLIYNSIMNGPYVRRMIREPGDPDCDAEVNKLRAERLARAHDPLALMENSNNPYNNPVFHQDQPSPVTYMQQPQPSFNMNYMQQPMPNPEDIIDPITAMNMTLVLMAKAFKLNYSTPTNNNQRISSNRHHMLDRNVMESVVQIMQFMKPSIKILEIKGHIVVSRMLIQNVNPKGMVMLWQHELMVMQMAIMTQLLIAQKEEAHIQIHAKEFDLMAIVGVYDKIKEVDANCTLKDNLQQALTSGAQIDSALVYD
ncbi:hypothetical protein Tco_1147989 [Tanacetum coccineum]